jgi:hypothetical protein
LEEVNGEFEFAGEKNMIRKLKQELEVLLEGEAIQEDDLLEEDESEVGDLLDEVGEVLDEQEATSKGVIEALRDTDYKDKDAFFKMVQLLKGLAVNADKDEKAKKFLSAVSDALTTAAKKVLGEDVELDEARKSKKAREREINAAYYKYFENIQVDIFDLSKIMKAIGDAIDSGADLDKEIPKLVSKYKQN